MPRRERDSEGESLKHKENQSKDTEKWESAKPGRLGMWELYRAMCIALISFSGTVVAIPSDTLH